MVINVWTSFTKRSNSTLQPTGGTQKTVYLKDGCSLHNPVFILASPVTEYTYVQAFGNYYFVTDVVNLDGNRSEIHCDLDVLATYKSDITSYTAFVERSASNYDAYVRDPALSQQQDIVYEDSTVTDISAYMNTTGMYVTTVLNKTHGLVLYLTNNIDVYKIILNSGLYSASDISDWITSGIAAAFDLDVYIGSVKWMPLDLSSHGLTQTTLDVGPIGFPSTHWPSGTIVKITTPEYRVGGSIAVSLPSSYFGDFRDADPRFVQYTITLPGVGTVQLDSAFVGSCIKNSRTFYDYYMVDISTGLITHSLETIVNSNAVHLCDLKGSIGVDVPIGKSRANVTETATAFIGGTGNAVSNLMSGGIISGVTSSLLTGVNTIDSAITPQTAMFGGSGNRTELYVTSQYINVSRHILGSKQFPTSVAGRPLMQNVQLSTLSGYCKCGNASVPINGDIEDRETINNYLNSGFYLE